MGLWLSKHCVVSTATDNTVVLPVSCTLYQSLLFLSFFCYYFCFIYNNDVSNPFVLFLFFLVFPLLLLLLPPLCRPPSPFHCPSIPPSPLQDVHLSRFPQELWHRMQSKPCTSLRLWRYCTLSSNLSPFFLLVLLFFTGAFYFSNALANFSRLSVSAPYLSAKSVIIASFQNISVTLESQKAYITVTSTVIKYNSTTVPTRKSCM